MQTPPTVFLWHRKQMFSSFLDHPVNAHCFMSRMICLVIRIIWTWLVRHEQGRICYFGKKLHFRDSGIGEISGLGSGLKSRRDPDPGIAISTHHLPDWDAASILASCRNKADRKATEAAYIATNDTINARVGFIRWAKPAAVFSIRHIKHQRT